MSRQVATGLSIPWNGLLAADLHWGRTLGLPGKSGVPIDPTEAESFSTGVRVCAGGHLSAFDEPAVQRMRRAALAIQAQEAGFTPKRGSGTAVKPGNGCAPTRP